MDCINIIVLVFPVFHRCLSNARNKLVGASLSVNVYRSINGADLPNNPANAM